MAFRKAFAMVSSSIGSAAGVGHIRYRRYASCCRFMHSRCRAAHSHEQVKNSPVRDIPAVQSSFPWLVTFFRAFVKISALFSRIKISRYLKRAIMREHIAKVSRNVRTVERLDDQFYENLFKFQKCRILRYRGIAHEATIGEKLMQRHEKRSFFFFMKCKAEICCM